MTITSVRCHGSHSILPVLLCPKQAAKKSEVKGKQNERTKRNKCSVQWDAAVAGSIGAIAAMITDNATTTKKVYRLDHWDKGDHLHVVGG